MEFDEIVVKESPGLCRCCLSEGCYKDMGTEYSWMNDNEVYADMLLECFDISISQHNDGPNGPNRLICEVCITRLRDACYFKKQVLDSEKKFVDMIGRGEFRPKVLFYQAQLKSEAVDETPADDAEVEYLEDEMDFGDDEPLKSLSLEADSEAGADAEAPADADVTASPLPARAKRGRPKKTALKTEKKKLKTEKTKTKTVVKGVGDDSIYASTALKRQINLQLLLNNTSVIAFNWKNLYQCFFCDKPTFDNEELRKHTMTHGDLVKTVHSLKKLKRSSVCIKLDVSDMGCRLCDTQFVSIDELVQHLIDDHGVKYDREVCMYMQIYDLSHLRCLVCDETFVYSSLLISHVDEKHPVQSYVCDECHFAYATKEFLEKHILKKHTEVIRLTDTEEETETDKGKDVNVSKQDIVKFLAHCTAVPFKKIRGGIFCCVSCPFRNSDMRCLVTHYGLSHKNADFKIHKLYTGVQVEITSLSCQKCSQAVDDLEAMVEHLQLEHKIKIGKEVILYFMPFKILDGFSCYMCDLKFATFTMLYYHVDVDHVVDCDLSKLCPRCGIRVYTFSYREHSRRYHLNSVKCTECGNEYPSTELLKAHQHVHNFEPLEYPVSDESDQECCKNRIGILRKRKNGRNCSCTKCKK